MLALMAQPTQTSFVNMSAAVLSSSSLERSTPSFSQRTTADTTLSKRPKLSLNTSQVPLVFGRKSTSLRLETLSVTSPTSRHTFQNTYEDLPSPALSAQVASHATYSQISSKRPLTLTPLQTSPVVELTPVSPSTFSVDSTSSYSSSRQGSVSVPYRLTFSLYPILKNGSIPRTKHRPSSAPTRPMFPAQKRVSFRQQLTETIQTSTYQLAHSDISDSESALVSALDLPAPRFTFEKTRWVRDTEKKTQGDAASSLPTPRESTSPQAGEKRDSSSSEDEDEEDSALYPKTPVAGRRKRQREWVWTLGPQEQDTPRVEEQAQRHIPLHDQSTQ